MNGISCLISKPFSPIYNPIARTKPNIIPCRSSTLHLKSTSPFLANTRVLKHCVNSSSADKDVTGSRSETPDVSVGSVPYGLIGLVCITGLALLKAQEVAASFIASRGILKSNSRYSIFLGLAAVFVAGNYLASIMYGFTLGHYKVFSIGDKIEIGSVKGEVIEMGLLNTTLRGLETGGRIVVANSWFLGQTILNRLSPGWCLLESKLFVKVNGPVQIDEMNKIKEEIVNILKSYPNVYLEEKQPYCTFSESERDLVDFTFGCNLKPMSENELHSVKQDITSLLSDIIKKYSEPHMVRT